ncbi:glutamate-gated chloride channel-like [Galendromus occidentalis]|uniref:Glutamate-gated chloride channel-like n=1 Tax=Galendromus occidentalis TaxID=34638 RepID=A0AAJ6VZ83_9ACAR|nr:glutamate-gated chloride channel-like [Galendromus occidentalis]
MRNRFLNVFLVIFPSCLGDCVQDSIDVLVLDCILEGYDVSKGPETDSLVNVSMFVESIASSEETSLDYSFRIQLIHHYIDERLQYDPGNNSVLQGLNAWYHLHRIWRPFVLVIENRNILDFNPADDTMRVWPTGLVEYTRSLDLDLSCRTLLDVFPFDFPVCMMTMTVSGFSENDVKLNWTDKDLPMMSTFFYNAYPVRYTLSACRPEEVDVYNATCLKSMILFTRDRGSYWVTVFIPGFILVTSSFMAFWVSIRCVPPRAMIGMTNRLTFLSAASSFRNQLPMVSNLEALNIWDSVSILFIYVSLLELIIVDHLQRHPRDGQETDSEFRRRELQRADLTHWDRFCLYFRKPNAEIGADIDAWCRGVFPVLYFFFIIGYFITFHGHYGYNTDYTYDTFEALIS